MNPFDEDFKVSTSYGLRRKMTSRISKQDDE
jgi:hypothetical protein